MTTINFQSITFKNFLSFGNTPTTILLNKSPTTLVQGQSGSGKSTILEAITFALYGVPFRNIKKPSLCNSVNNKECETRLKFSVGEKQYEVVRGIKPNIFEIYIDNVMVDQNAHMKDYQKYLEDCVLQITFKTWIQVVNMGYANFSPFLWLDPKSRRVFVDEILGTGVFQKMLVRVKDEQNIAKTRLSLLDVQITHLKTSIKTSKAYLASLQRHDDNKASTLKQQIEIERENISNIEHEISSTATIAMNIAQNISDKSSLVVQATCISDELKAKASRISLLQSDVLFFRENTKCPVCVQEIDANHAAHLIDQRMLETESISVVMSNLQLDLADLKSKIVSHTEASTELARLKQILNTAKASLVHRNDMLSTKVNELNDTTTQSSDMIRDVAANIVKDCEAVNRINEEKMQIHDRARYLQIMVQMLREDGIKASIIKSYIPLLNKTINRYLDVMGFNMRFSFDEEFNETILARFHDSMAYNNLSQGEQARINLAIVLSWREVAMSRNAISTNLICFDEVLDSTLAAADTEAVLSLIREISANGTNVFVISHRPEVLYNSFRSVITIAKDGNFSKIV